MKQWKIINYVRGLEPHGIEEMVYNPKFVSENIWLVKKGIENINSGFDIVYLVWNNEGFKHKELMDSSNSREYITIDSILNGFDNLKIKLSDNGNEKTFEFSKKELGF